MKTKIRKIGNSLGVILPKEVLARMHVGEGDEVSVGEGPGKVILSAYDEEIARQVEIGADFMHEYRDVFRALAK